MHISTTQRTQYASYRYNLEIIRELDVSSIIHYDTYSINMSPSKILAIDVTSLYVEFNEFNGNIIICWPTVSAKPQFSVISCCKRQVLCKPWRVVELTACAVGCAVLTIPEDIIGIEYILVTPDRVKATLTEVIISNKCRDKVVVGCITRTILVNIAALIHFCCSSSKCPNVLAPSTRGTSMSQT